MNSEEKRFFVLDTNVLMHDPAALFRFMEHDVYLPMVVLEELDAGKKGLSEVARNARQASRFLDDLVKNASKEEIDQGLPLPAPESEGIVPGKLYLQTTTVPLELPPTLPGDRPDNTILGTVLALDKNFPERNVTLVSKDINLRIKAAVLGIKAEDYFNDKVLDDLDLLYSGTAELPADFWETHSKDMKSWNDEGHTFYTVTGDLVNAWHINQCLYMESEPPFSAIVRNIDKNTATLEVIKNYLHGDHTVWGIHARNREQNFALNFLMDPDIDFVSLMGTAGTGKTLLTLASALTQTMDDKRYREIIFTRVTIPVGEDIGFLPGTEEEKMTPWMGALMDNLEVLTKEENSNGSPGGNWGRAVTQDLIQNRISIRSLNFMRGRTFLNKFIIIDEAQNLTSKQLKTLITRAGPGTKIVCLGNVGQIDTPYLTETTSGLTYIVDRFKDWPHGGHITLHRGERSRLADFASEIL
ncbi:MAG: PhoH family protein [Gammaproteobacteria bacterium]|nr:PhoH family protein [Gammaproteobacteria bacterium]MDH5613659.1 PhoH family protein [Gammaproteobacteria bacterium]